MSSSTIRAEFALIAAGFVKTAPYTGHGSEFVTINAGGTALEYAAAGSGAVTKILDASGSNTDTAAVNLASVAVTLAAGDKILFIVDLDVVTADHNGIVMWDGSAPFAQLGSALANQKMVISAIMGRGQVTDLDVEWVGTLNKSNTLSVIGQTGRSHVGWTSAWTLSFRSIGAVATCTFRWRVRAYQMAG